MSSENGVVVDHHDEEMKRVIKSDSDNSLSSSVGKLSNGVGGDDEAGEEAVSKAEVDEGSLYSLTTLEAALPFKRGLSGFYTGKSKSFVNLLEVKCLAEMEKDESPLNKRRRLNTTQNAMYKRGSSSSSMPVLTRSEGSAGVEQEFKSSTGNTSFSSSNSATKPSIK